MTMDTSERGFEHLNCTSFGRDAMMQTARLINLLITF
jgi:hypothetical protein